MAKRYAFISDAQKIPIHNKKVDIVISIHVLEHLSDDVVALKEISRILSQVGIAILMIPEWPISETIEFSFPNPEEYMHFRRYGLDFTGKLKKIFGEHVYSIYAPLYFGYESPEFSAEKIFLCCSGDIRDLPPLFLKQMAKFAST